MRATFGSVQEYRQVISRAYPEFTDYKSVLFGKATSDQSGNLLALPITLTGQDGVVVQAMFILVQEGEGYKVMTVIGGSSPNAGRALQQGFEYSQEVAMT